MRLKSFIFFALAGLYNTFGYTNTEKSPINNLKIEAPEYVIGDQFAEIKFEALNPKGYPDSAVHGKRTIKINGENSVIDFTYGQAFSTFQVSKTQSLSIEVPESQIKASLKIRCLPPWLSIIPPLIAIVLALITKEVIISLFASIFLGVLTLKGFELSNIIPALVTVIDTYILNSLNNTQHLSVIIFSFLIGGMVSLISQNGGMKGIVNRLSGFAHSSRSSQLTAFFMSLGIFYDNYANTLIVGNTMRPVTDKYKVSREKLAFIVHGTAASVTSIAFVTTWIGAELGYINDAIANLGIEERTYSLFLKSLQFAFYPVLMLFFIFFLIFLKKDYGPMNRAEVERRNAGVINENQDTKEKEEIEEDIKLLKPQEEGKQRWLNAFIPVMAVIVIAFAGLLITGAKNSYVQLLHSGIKIHYYSFSEVWDNLNVLHKDKSDNVFHKIGVLIGNSDFYIPLLWSAFAGVSCAVLLTIVQKRNKIRVVMESMVHGFRMVLSAVIILVFAWALAEVIEDLHTSDYISTLISSKFIYPQFLPAIIFILAGLFSFATGSVWGTMAILYPLLLPVTWILCVSTGFELKSSQEILYAVTAAIITGSTFGNHCSPISDTTIVSSISSDCDHVTHIKTQLPYALTVAGISFLLFLFMLTGLHWAINYLLGIALIFVIVKYLGKTTE
ncbi:MAG: Na+/H+ antiporter NhaC family protein [Cytophagaceae bacterium]|nr:Na+/H+ antiporter NhaC family protein [Cytophagaceae bacterium]